MNKIEEKKKITKADVQKRLDEEYEKDTELVSGIFRMLEKGCNVLRFRFKKYKQDENKQYELHSGERYRLPRMVVKHLNNNVHYMKYKKVSEVADSNMAAAFNDGSVKTMDKMTVMEKDPRCEFIPMDFGSDAMDLLPNKIIQVSNYY